MSIKYNRPVFHWDAEKGEYTKPKRGQYADRAETIANLLGNVSFDNPIKDITKEVNEINSIKQITD